MELIRSWMNIERDDALVSTIFKVFLWYMLANKRDKMLIVNNCESNNTFMISQGLFIKGFISTSSCCCCLVMDADILNTVGVT